MEYYSKTFDITFRPKGEEHRGMLVSSILSMSRAYSSWCNIAERSVSVYPDRNFVIERDGGIRMKWKVVVLRSDKERSKEIICIAMDDFVRRMFGEGIIDYFI